MLTLNRLKLLLIGTGLSLLFALLSRVDVLLNSSRAQGTVINIVHRSAGRYGSNEFPVVRFETDNSIITFEGGENLDYQKGDAVPVIYRASKPRDARIFSFAGFWMIPFIWCLVPIIVLISFLYSFLSAGDLLTVSFAKGLQIKLIRDPRLARQEELEELRKEEIRKKALEGMKRRQHGGR